MGKQKHAINITNQRLDSCSKEGVTMTFINPFLTPDGKQSDFMQRKVTWTLLWCGAIALCLGGYLIIHEQQAMSVGIKTTGAVAENILVHDGTRGGSTYHPRISFVTNKGESFDFQSNTGSSPAMYTVGEIVPVLYNPANPTVATIDSFLVSWFPIMLCLLIGTVFLILGLRRIQKQK